MRVPEEWVLSFATKFNVLGPERPNCASVPMPYGIMGLVGPLSASVPVPYSILDGIGIGVATSTSWKMQQLAALLGKTFYLAPEFVEEVGFFPHPDHDTHDVRKLLRDLEAEQTRSSVWLSLQRVKIRNHAI